jgi:hypothetical protein
MRRAVVYLDQTTANQERELRACVVPTINLFLIRYVQHPKWCVSMAFRQGFFGGFFRTPDANAPAPRTPCARKPLGDLAIGIDAGEIDGPDRPASLPD